MKSNCIEFYKNNNKLIARIHISNKVKVIKNPLHINKLIKIVEKYGYKINKPCIIKQDVEEINKEYEHYIQKKKIKNIKFYNTITPKMKLKKSKTGKIILIGTLISLMIANKENIVALLPTQTYNYNQDYENNMDDEVILEIPNVSNINYFDYENSIDDEDSIEIPTTSNINYLDYENAEINNMLNDQYTFTYQYDNSENSENFQRAKEYEDIFTKYGEMYGIDPNLLMAIAAQESSGKHYENLNNGPAQGIMQIEKSVHLNQKITAYNHLTNQEESIVATEENLENIETNIKIGAMILQNALEFQNYNIVLGLQTYNFGQGNITKVLNMCEELSGTPIADMKNNMNNTEWRYYRDFLDIGDPLYVEHVFSFLNSSNENNIEEVYVLNRANQKFTLNLNNQALTSKKI